MNQHREYLDELVEAQLEDRNLPEPDNDEERHLRQIFEDTQDIFDSFQHLEMPEQWHQQVWNRAESLSDDFPGAAATSDAQDLDAPHENTAGGNVIDASNRFRRWSAIGGIIAVAAAMLLLVPFFLTGKSDEASAPASARSSDDAPPAGSPQAAVFEPEAEEEDESTMAKLDQAKETAPAADKLKAASRKNAPKTPTHAEAPLAEKALAGAAATTPAVAAAPPMDADTEKRRKNLPGAGDGSEGDWTGKGSGASKGKPSPTAPDGNNSLKTQPALTAGETNDNENFDAFQQFLAERPKAHLEEMDVSERMFIRVLDAKNRPLPNTQVTFKSNKQEVFNGMTYSDGWLLFHPKSIASASQATSFDLTFTHGQTTLDYTINRGAKERWEVRMPLERAIPARPQVDVVFLIDTTGSMSDEIERLQATILDLSDKVAQLPGNPEARFGLVLYRDDGEDYVSQLHEFTPDVNAFKETLGAVTADGGGDTPERLEVGLHRSIHEMPWGEKSTRLIFLIADAPPHRADLNEFSYSRDIQTAVSKGIKVYPVASSGLNDDGEYVLRQLAQYTMARFLFLTYGASGDFTPHDIPKDSFQPTTLDGLIIKIIRSEIQGLQLDKGGLVTQ